MVPDDAATLYKGHVRHGEMHVAHTFDRSTLDVTVKARTTVRTLELEDTASGDSLALEGRRLGWDHAKDVITALSADDLAEATPTDTARFSGS
jgi:predicted NBD/HSP70 family sugar kinase